jgi:hypothetical protein
MRTALPGRGRQCTQFFSEGAIDAERHVAARFVFEIISGEAAGERELQAAKICLHEAAATARVVFLVAERAAFKPEREARRKAIARPRQAPILLKRGSVRRIDGEEPQRRKVEPAFRCELEPDRSTETNEVK